MESGKRMAETKKNIIVTFKHPSPCLCAPGSEHTYKNRVVFAIEPEEEIRIDMWVKKPGFGLGVTEKTFKLPFRSIMTTQYVEEYEKLLYDVITGDQTSFITTEEVKAMWRFTDPIVKGWKKNLVPLYTYKPDSEKIRNEAKAFFAKS